jgi:hypothetical protein
MQDRLLSPALFNHGGYAMRARIGAFLALMSCGWLIAVVGPAHGQEFKLYASSDGRYKVLFPGAVRTDVVQVSAGKAKIPLTIDTVELLGGTAFMVTFIDTPDDVAMQPAATRLDKVRDGNKGDVGKVLEEKDLTIGTEKYAARDVLIEKGDGCIRNRIVIAGNRLYQVMITGKKDVVSSPSASKFLDSFEVTK